MKKESLKKILAGAPPHTRRARFLAWHTSLPLWQRSLLWVAFALAFVGFIQLGVNAYLFYQSLTSDDLALFLSLQNDSITLAPSSQTVVTATFGTKNLPLCSAACSWNATNLASGAILAGGSATYASGVRDTLTVPVRAAVRGEEDVLVRIEVACRNEPSPFCKSSGDVRRVVDTVRVRTRYDDETRASRERVESLIGPWFTSATEIEQTLLAVLAAANGTNRFDEYRAAAAQDKQTLTTLVQRAQAAIDRDDYAAAETVLREPLPTDVVRILESDSQREQAVREKILALNEQVTTSRALETLAPQPDAALLRSAANALTSSLESFASQPLANTERTVATYEALQRDLEARSAQWVAGVNNQSAAFAQEWRVACAVTSFGCERITQPAVTLAQAVTLQEETCTQAPMFLMDLNETRRALARQIAAYEQISNDSLESVEEALNISELRASASFQARIPALRAQAVSSNASALNLTAQEQLAYPLTDVSVPLAPSACPPRNATIQDFPVPQPLLNTLQPVQASIPAITLPNQRCCGDGICVTCPAPARTAVVFVHGFSFAQATTPESNTNAMVPLAHYLDEQGTATYIGHVFPQQSTQSSNAVTAGLPGSYSMTTTYYYDSYAEEGTVRFIPQKSENIETYSLRLREAIALAKARTGSEKVVIVAHSMGGLVSRRYLQLFGEQDVAALIMIGTPNAGITGRTEQFCDVFGSPVECEDMNAGSLFLNKVNAAPPPTIPVYTFSGIGCDKRAWDGIVEAASVELPYANNTIIEGACIGTTQILHNNLINPQQYPAVAQAVQAILEDTLR